jgi:hypothetical protein
MLADVCVTQMLGKYIQLPEGGLEGDSVKASFKAGKIVLRQLAVKPKVRYTQCCASRNKLVTVDYAT